MDKSEILRGLCLVGLGLAILIGSISTLIWVGGMIENAKEPMKTFCMENQPGATGQVFWRGDHQSIDCQYLDEEEYIKWESFSPKQFRLWKEERRSE